MVGSGVGSGGVMILVERGQGKKFKAKQKLIKNIK
jgi:hypothetical protein